MKDIGLWGPQVQEALAAMGAIEFAKVDAGTSWRTTPASAEEFDAGTGTGLRRYDGGLSGEPDLLWPIDEDDNLFALQGERGRGPRSGRVRRAAPRPAVSAPLTLPSPPASGGEG